MGLTRTKLKIKNPQHPSKEYEGNFLVDSGATYTVVPKDVLTNLGIKADRTEEFTLADGSVVKRQIGNALFEYQGKTAAAPVIMGEKGDTMLLGVFTLEALGLVLDPLRRTIHSALLRL